jgi:hypothetical protein
MDTFPPTSPHGDGIGLIEQNRGAGPYGPYKVLNAQIHHNDITYFGNFGQTGAETDYPGGATIHGGSNLFDFNTYHAPRLDWSRWTWSGNKNWAAFQLLGQEPNGEADTIVPAQPGVSCSP